MKVIAHYSLICRRFLFSGSLTRLLQVIELYGRYTVVQHIYKKVYPVTCLQQTGIIYLCKNLDIRIECRPAEETLLLDFGTE